MTCDVIFVAVSRYSYISQEKISEKLTSTGIL